MMGGAFSWLFIIQAALIGNLFLAANYYLWLGMGRIDGAGQYQKFIKYLLIAIALCFAVWATPRSIISTVSEVRAMGGSSHPQLGFLGVMSAKNTAVNILILSTYMSFLLYRRGGKRATHPLRTLLNTTAVRHLRPGGGHRDLLRDLRLLRRGRDAHQVLDPAGAVGAGGHGADHRAGRDPVPQRREDG